METCGKGLAGAGNELGELAISSQEVPGTAPATKGARFPSFERLTGKNGKTGSGECWNR